MAPLRKILFALYAVAIGASFAPILYRAIPDAPVAVVVLTLVLAIALVYCAWSSAGEPNWPTWRLLLLVPLMPFMFLVGLLLMGALLLMIAVLWPFLALQGMVAERKFRNKLKSKGRFLELVDLRFRLDAGLGTLILEWAEKGPHRIWWTEDNVLSLGELVLTQEDFAAAFQGQHPSNTRCQSEYLDDNAGKACLTSLPARYARSGKLASLFPKMKTAIVCRRAAGH